MQEWIDVRAWSESLVRSLPPDVGQANESGSRRMVLRRDSPNWKRIEPILRKHPEEYLAIVSRRYSEHELSQAEALTLLVTKIFEPEGEACGTVYDYSQVCAECGAGRRQMSDLHLRLRRVYQEWPSIPLAAKTGIARTIGDEIIVSATVADLMRSEHISGAELRPVRGEGPKGQITPAWKQLWITGTVGRTIPPTQFGNSLVDLDPRGEYRCSRGHVKGFDLLSEVYLDRTQWNGSDIAVTDDLVGWDTGGVGVPSPIMLISQRFYRLLQERKVKGYKVEVAHLV